MRQLKAERIYSESEKTVLEECDLYSIPSVTKETNSPLKTMANKNFESYGKLLRLATLGPFYYATILIESYLEPYFNLRFPRNHDELIRTPAKLFEILKANQKQLSDKAERAQASDLLPFDSAFESIENAEVLRNEPDKNKTAGSYKLTYRVNEKKVNLNLFVKFQCGRGLPLWLQAVRAALETDIAREVKFYQCLSGQVEVRSPKPYYVDSIHAFNRVCLVLEHIDGLSIADWQGCPVLGIRGILREIARMNAKFLGAIGTDKEISWIPSREGLECVSFIADFIANQPLWYREVWAALVAYFKQQPVTLIHGDCRPGNMLFLKDSNLAKQITRKGENDVSVWFEDDSYPGVVFTDWEATNVGPLLSDFSYCVTLGLTVADRQAYEDRLLKEFLSSLQEYGVPSEQCDWEKCKDEVELLRIVLYYVDVAVRREGLWDKQGNTKQDGQAWVTRINAALRDIDSGRVAERLNIAKGTINRLKEL